MKLLTCGDRPEEALTVELDRPRLEEDWELSPRGLPTPLGPCWSCWCAYGWPGCAYWPSDLWAGCWDDRGWSGGGGMGGECCEGGAAAGAPRPQLTFSWRGGCCCCCWACSAPFWGGWADCDGGERW